MLKLAIKNLKKTETMTYIFSKINKYQRPLFYRDKRVLLSFLVSLPILFMGYVFPAVVAHLATGVFWDWWFFSHKKVKESDVTPSVWLDAVGMTTEQLDEHSKVFMWLRHGAFVVCSIAAMAHLLFGVGIACSFNFAASYFFFRLSSCFYLSWKDMIYPWIGAQAQTTEQQSGYQPDPFYFSRKNYDLPSARFDMADPSNPMGYNNVSSPNYIFNKYPL